MACHNSYLVSQGTEFPGPLWIGRRRFGAGTGAGRCDVDDFFNNWVVQVRKGVLEHRVLRSLAER